jgi:hypothetical protein
MEKSEREPGGRILLLTSLTGSQYSSRSFDTQVKGISMNIKHPRDFRVISRHRPEMVIKT